MTKFENLILLLETYPEATILWYRFGWQRYSTQINISAQYLFAHISSLQALAEGIKHDATIEFHVETPEPIILCEQLQNIEAYLNTPYQGRYWHTFHLG